MFLDEKIALYLSGRWMYPKIQEKANFNWQIAPFPIGPTPLPCDSSGWAISKYSKHKNTSVKFVQFLSSEKSANYFTNTGLIVPARKKTAQLLNTDNHNEKTFIEIINHSQNTKVTQNSKKNADKINLRISE